MLVDACRNDPSVRGRRGVDHVNVTALPAQTGVLLSCSPGEFSFEHKSLGSGHGVFFYHVIEGLKGAAKDADDSDISWDGLRTYVKKKVPATVRNLYGKDGGEQRPNEVGNLSGEPTVLAIARIVTRPEPKPEAPAAVVSETRPVAAETDQGAGRHPEAKPLQQPDQHAENSPNGFWLSRSAIKRDERVAFSLAQPSDRSDGTGSTHFDQNFSRAAIGRKVEAGEKLFVHDFSVEFLPDAEHGTDSGSRGRGLWFIRDAKGKYQLGYDREKLSAREKRRRGPTRQWLPIEDNSVRTIVGRSLTRGERAFLHDPKVDKIP